MTREGAIIILTNVASLLRDGTRYMKPEHEKQFREAYEMAIKALEQPEQRWIPCTPDTMPEEAGEYLCTLVGVHNQGLPVECGYEPHNQKGMITGWSTCEADGFKLLRDEEVVAWMPLPEPYGGEQE